MISTSVLIKPTSSSCNLQCKYCFYHDVAERREVKNYGMMEETTLENLVKKGFESTDYMITFAFQGGEPTLRGLAFYRKFQEYVIKYNVNQIQVQYSLQTNGMLITEEWARFFRQHNYLIGLSLDGPKEINDLYRVDGHGNGSYDAIMRTVTLFNRYQVEYNILTVVNRTVAQHGTQVYEFLKKQGFRYLQFIPCLDDLGEVQGSNPHSLSSPDFQQFLTTIFDLWYKDMKQERIISIRMFENVLNILLNYSIESCDMRGVCSVHAVIEADGSVYPCDFYVLDHLRLGNINDTSLEEMLTGPLAKKFITGHGQAPASCTSCKFYRICRGGCRRHRDCTGDTAGTNYFCEAFRGFYDYSLPRFAEIAQVIQHHINNDL